jgi:glycine oxidase
VKERAADLIVVGGGVIGLAVAREAARAGNPVKLLERGAPGGEASSASAGMIVAQIELHAESPLLPLCLASRDLYPAFVESLERESGVRVDFRVDGALVAALDAEGLREIEETYQFQSARGLPIERIEGEALRRL